MLAKYQQLVSAIGLISNEREPVATLTLPSTS